MPALAPVTLVSALGKSHASDRFPYGKEKVFAALLPTASEH